MQFLDLTLPELAANVALDEALLERAENAGRPQETLRLWESPQPAVVLGRASRVAEEVDTAECQRCGVDLTRRASGGTAVVVGPGCLMYAVVLSYELRPELAALDTAHACVLDRLCAALSGRLPGVVRRGTSDLALAGESAPPRKFSGNSLKCKRTHLLYHGTLLYDFPLDLIGTCLRSPPRQPEYRASRAHGDFLANLPLPVHELRQLVLAAWQPLEPTSDWPRERTNELAQRNRQAEWIFAR